jgi:hypothetical protein
MTSKNYSHSPVASRLTTPKGQFRLDQLGLKKRGLFTVRQLQEMTGIPEKDPSRWERIILKGRKVIRQRRRRKCYRKAVVA